MKFGKRLQFEAGEDWREHYIAYSMLKRMLEKCVADPSDTAAREAFLKEVRANVDKISAHFASVLNEVQQKTTRLITSSGASAPTKVASETTPLISNGSITQSPSNVNSSGIEEDDDGDAVGCTDRTGLRRVFMMCIGERLHQGHTKRQLQYRKLYRLALRIGRFADLNREGIRKVMKKFDKNLGTKESSAILSYADATPFQMRRGDVDRIREDIEREYHAEFNEPLQKYGELEVPSGQWHVKWRWLVVSFFVMMAILAMPLFPSRPTAHRCLAMISCILTLWLTEAIPFFCTAMFIPLLAVWLDVLTDPQTDQTLSAVQSAHILLMKVFGPTQVLVLGGLVMAKAIAKHKLEAKLADMLQRTAGHRPSLYMLGIMMLGLFLSSFVSNIAAPVLLLSVIQHTLWDIPANSGAQQAILLGLAISCNFGGMLTPISSPQNAVALQVLASHKLSINFFTWLTLAAPVCISGVVLAWAILIWIWRPFENIRYIPTAVARRDEVHDKREMYLVLVVCAITVFLWVAQPISDAYFGDAAMVALFPIVVFFGVGVLSKDDFNTLSWHLLFLLAGGSMLGLCATQSHLVHVVLQGLRPILSTTPPWLVTVFVVSFVGLITSFISHTVGAMILLPVVLEVSNLNSAMPDARFLVFSAVTMCSGAMAFPITSFPNVNSLLAEDDTGKSYLLAKNFVLPGMLMTLFTLTALCTFMDPYMTFVLGASLATPAPTHL
eukprot:PhM_4_TR2872/c0_g1_i1/m.54953/K14430/PHO87_91; phosphate transporter